MKHGHYYSYTYSTTNANTEEKYFVSLTFKINSQRYFVLSSHAEQNYAVVIEYRKINQQKCKFGSRTFNQSINQSINHGFLEWPKYLKHC